MFLSYFYEIASIEVLVLTERGPHEARHRYDESQEKQEGGLCAEQYDATNHQGEGNWEHTVAQHTH